MALSAKKFSFAKRDGALGTGSQAVTGIGFQPKALILWLTPLTATGFQAGYSFSTGMSDGTTDFVVLGQSEDGSASSDCDRGLADSIIMVINTSATIVARANVTSFDADGFTLSWVTNAASAGAWIVHGLALGGADLTNVDLTRQTTVSAAGNQAFTGVGFKPDAVIFIHSLVSSTAAQYVSGYVLGGLGFATATGQGAISYASRSSAASGNTQRYQRTDLCVSAVLQGNVYAEAEFVSMDADGYTLNWIDPPGTTIELGCLALKGGYYQIGSGVEPDASTTQVIGTSGQPNAVLLASVCDEPQTGEVPHNRWGLGASDGSTDGATWVGDTHGAFTMETDSFTSQARALAMIDSSSPSAVANAVTGVAFAATSMTLTWQTTVPAGNAKEFLWLAMGDAAGSPLQTLSPTAIASLEDVGNPAVAAATVTLAPAAIASLEDFGVHTITPGAATLNPTAITSLEDIGTPGVVINIAPTGIASLEDFGAPTLAAGSITLNPSGIASLEDFGVPVLTVAGGTQLLLVDAIASAESLGVPALAAGLVTITPSAIASLEDIGAPRLDLHLAPSGIASLESLGAPTVTGLAVVLLPSSIASLEAFGSPTVLVLGDIFDQYGVAYRQINPANYPAGAQFFLEAFLKSSVAGITTSAKLVEVEVDEDGNITTLGDVTGSAISTATDLPVRRRSAALALPAGNRLYIIQYGGVAGATQSCGPADVVVLHS